MARDPPEDGFRSSLFPDGQDAAARQGCRHRYLQSRYTELQGFLQRCQYHCRKLLNISLTPAYVLTTLTQARNPRDPSTVLVLPRVDLARHLSVMPDRTSLADLLLPGTHDSVAFYGCESSPTSSLSVRSADEDILCWLSLQGLSHNVRRSAVR
jgi:hypothetical protein